MSDQLSANLLEREINVSNWDTLGTHLGLSQDEIKEIELDHQTTERRRVEMFDKWLKEEENPSWEKVIDALDCMSEKNLASQLRNKYLRPHCTLDTPTGTCSEEHSLVLKVHRKDHVARELERLKKMYFRLKMTAESALETANPSLRKLKRFSQEYLSDKEVTTVEELFDCLKEFCFLDYALLENIVSIFLDGEERIVTDLNDYIQQLTDFKTSTTLNEFMETIENAFKSIPQETGACTVTLRLVGGWLEKTMQDLDKLLREIFQDKTSVLAHLKIIRGSVIVTYLAPQSEEDCLIHFVQEKLFFIVLVGVCELSIGRKCINLSHNEVPQFSFESSLVLAVRNNDTSLLTFLLNINTCPDATDCEGWTALMRGSYSGRDKAVSLLVNAKANPNTRRYDGVTALYMAAQNGHSDVVNILLRAKADPNLPADDGTTPLNIARINGHSDVIIALQNRHISEEVIKMSKAATSPISTQGETIVPKSSEGATTMATHTVSEEKETITTRTISTEGDTTITTRTIFPDGETLVDLHSSTDSAVKTSLSSAFAGLDLGTRTRTRHVHIQGSEGAVAMPVKVPKPQARHFISVAKPRRHKVQAHHSISEPMIAKPKHFLDNKVTILDDANLQHILHESNEPKSVSIIMLGKSGSGKTSLSSAIADMELDTTITSTRRVLSQVDGGSVNIFDTHGLTGISETILDNAMISSHSKVVIILCMDMYEELDESLLKALTLFHRKFGRKFWLRVIIALTKADCYEEHKWLMSKLESGALEDKFEVDLEKWRTILREKFTAKVDRVEPSCHIGMTDREFNLVLNIPVIPTSQLNPYALERMQQVGHGYWFDVLLIKCCQRLRAQNCALQVHRSRLSQLPPHVWQEFSKAECRRLKRNRRKSADFHGAPSIQQTSSEVKQRFEFP